MEIFASSLTLGSFATFMFISIKWWMLYFLQLVWSENILWSQNTSRSEGDIRSDWACASLLSRITSCSPYISWPLHLAHELVKPFLIDAPAGKTLIWWFFEQTQESIPDSPLSNMEQLGALTRTARQHLSGELLSYLHAKSKLDSLTTWHMISLFKNGDSNVLK